MLPGKFNHNLIIDINFDQSSDSGSNSRLSISAEGSRGVASESLEDDGHVFDVFKTGHLGDSFERIIGFLQELFDLGYLDPANLCLG